MLENKLTGHDKKRVNREKRGRVRKGFSVMAWRTLCSPNTHKSSQLPDSNMILGRPEVILTRTMRERSEEERGASRGEREGSGGGQEERRDGGERSE